MTCARCGATIGENQGAPAYPLHPAFGLWLCELCRDKADQCAPDDEHESTGP